MPRPRNQLRAEEWKLQILEEVSVRVKLRLLDPTSGKPIYGSRSKLVNRLLLDWLREQEGRAPHTHHQETNTT